MANVHTKGITVKLNIYDLSPKNDYLHKIGFGLYHTSVEIQGLEYSFGGEGEGIVVSSTPKDVPIENAIFRESIEIGIFKGNYNDIQTVIEDLRTDDKFSPKSYDIMYKNCNHFTNALCWELLHKSIPSYCNRLADYGTCLTCFLLPKKSKALQQYIENGGEL